MLRRARPTVLEAQKVDAWQISRGEDDGHDLFARFNAAFRKAVDRESYPIQIGVALPLNEPDDLGLPTTEEGVALGEAEDVLLECAGDRAVLVGVITTHGMREFVLYTDQPDWVAGFREELQSAIASHSVQVMAQSDPGWHVYRTFVR